MSVRALLLGSMILCVSTALALPAAAFDANATFAKGTYVLSGEGSYGEQDSSFSFVVWGGAGISVFLTDTTATSPATATSTTPTLAPPRRTAAWTSTSPSSACHTICDERIPMRRGAP